MKAGGIVVILAGVVVATGIAYSFIRERDIAAEAEPCVAVEPDASSRVVNVDDLAEKPENFKGDIVLRAVVAGVNKSEGVFGAVDSREFESCGVLTCADNTLPVKFAGELPNVKTVVEITGRIVRNKKGLSIEAKRVEVVP